MTSKSNHADDYNAWVKVCDRYSQHLFGKCAQSLLNNKEETAKLLLESFTNNESAIEAVTKLRLSQANELWDALGEITIDEDETIESPFLHFNKGVDRTTIWQWLESTFNISIAIDILGLEGPNTYPIDKLKGGTLKRSHHSFDIIGDKELRNNPDLQYAIEIFGHLIPMNTQVTVYEFLHNILAQSDNTKTIELCRQIAN